MTAGRGHDGMRIHTVLVCVLIVGAAVYGTVQARFSIFGPAVTILEPAPFDILPQSFTLRGTAGNAVYLTVNDRRIFPNRSGMFETDLLMPGGYTIVEVYAHSRQKRKTVIHLPLYIKHYDDKKENNG